MEGENKGIFHEQEDRQFELLNFHFKKIRISPKDRTEQDWQMARVVLSLVEGLFQPA